LTEVGDGFSVAPAWSVGPSPPAAGVVLFVATAAVLVGSLWAVTEFVDDKEVRLAAAFVFGLAFLLAVISGIVAAFSALQLTSPKTALGLPEGSIRAIIALVLVLIFVVMAIYMIEAVFLGEDTNDQAHNAATQVLATVGTLVAAVAAFYFGTGAVTAGTTAATAAVAAARARPAAVTKGSLEVSGGYELVGVVNPHGQETNYYFEYGEKEAYGNRTPPASAGAEDAEREVRSEAVAGIQPGWHVRIVAFNDSGTSYGADSEVGGR
jgi:lipoprotein-anchoring transpeptidase ErfK/SrfK